MMDFRFFITVIGLLLLLTAAGSSIADEEQATTNQEQPLITPAPALSEAAAMESMDLKASVASLASFVGKLDLKMYEAASGDLLVCGDEKFCLENAKTIKGWLCMDAACDGTDKSKKPFDCLALDSDQYSKETQDQINVLVCPLIKSPSAETRRSLMNHVPDINNKVGEDSLVEDGAYLMAFKGSAASCKDYIKNYVGAYGPQWTYKWYRALSGCRILAHETTREQEENDFYIWFGVEQGFRCSNIVNSELSYACSTPGATSPKPTDRW